MPSGINQRIQERIRSRPPPRRPDGLDWLRGRVWPEAGRSIRSEASSSRNVLAMGCLKPSGVSYRRSLHPWPAGPMSRILCENYNEVPAERRVEAIVMYGGIVYPIPMALYKREFGRSGNALTVAASSY